MLLASSFWLFMVRLWFWHWYDMNGSKSRAQVWLCKEPGSLRPSRQGLSTDPTCIVFTAGLALDTHTISCIYRFIAQIYVYIYITCNYMNVIHCNTTLIPHNQIIYILHMIHMIIYDHICTCIFYDAHTHTSCTWAELRPRTWEMPWPKRRRSWKSSATFASDSAIWTHMLNPWWDKKSGWNSWNMLKPSTTWVKYQGFW